ncbi:hypothetical protein HZB78_05520 [Candidatus Collierbacteria bacterium]|nr:hypothetical protein [Candidatus Collierbacteria bacterium]
MAHRIIPDLPEKPPSKFKKALVQLAHRAAGHKGRYGISFFIGLKEIFLGITVSQIEIPTIQRRKKVQKGKVVSFFPTEW